MQRANSLLVAHILMAELMCNCFYAAADESSILTKIILLARSWIDLIVRSIIIVKATCVSLLIYSWLARSWLSSSCVIASMLLLANHRY
jgi:hypothetical protein